MAIPSNFLAQVQTYQNAHLAFLLNYSCFIHTANKKFKDFNKMTANLGDTVTFDLPPRFVTQPSLVANFQPSTQRVQPLVVSNAANTSYAFTSQQFIFNVEEYMKIFGKAAVAELATQVEGNVAGLAETQPYRFYGDGVTQINSFGQLASMLALYRTYGYAHEQIKVYLSDIAVPQIVNSGLNQFVMTRNEDMAMSWMVGNWQGVDFYQSNLLPVHIAGNVGNNADVLTVISTNDPTGANITQITFSGAGATDPDAVLQYDSFQFADNVSGQPNMRYLTFVGHLPSASPVQFQATANAASNGSGDVTVSIYPALCSQVGNPNQNISFNVVAGMQCTVLPSHRCGLIVGGDALYLGMPRLPEQPPFDTANTMDEETGVSIRLTYGSILGQNTMGFINDTIWGQTIPGEYAMKIAFPL
jgi:hypothetical protein